MGKIFVELVQVTMMKLKVDLECEKCYKKVKKDLCKYLEIRDQEYDLKQNIVTIRVVSNNPEKIRDKLCCKGGGSIKSIEIVDPPKLKPPEPEKKKGEEKSKPKATEPEKKKGEEKPKPKAAEPKKRKGEEKPKLKAAEPEKKKGEEKPKPEATPAEPTRRVTFADLPPVQSKVIFPGPAPVSVLGYPASRPSIPIRMYYEGPVGYADYYGRPIYDSYGGGSPGYMGRNNQFFSEENALGCAIV